MRLFVRESLDVSVLSRISGIRSPAIYALSGLSRT